MKNLTSASYKGFASDNWSGASPEVLQAIVDVNAGHHPAYGENDPFMDLATQKFREVFGDKSRVFFVFNGTGANVLALQQLVRSWEGVVTPHSSHLNEDEAGAPEKFSGSKLLTVYCEDGKLKPAQIEPFIQSFGFQHHSQAKLVSISQVTELGTIYTLSEIKALADFAHANNMYLHMDGARIANAAAALGCSLKEMTTDCGVDVISFGGTKNGLMFGEAVVFTDEKLAEGFQYYRKQGMQLASKMRYIIAQFITYLENDLWKRNAQNANQMARLLGEKLSAVKGISLSRPVEANGVFAIIPKDVIPELQKKYFFHVWNESKNEVRLMCSFDTNLSDVEGFVSVAAKLMNGH
ncbi:MAG TPA: aminotransferase class V-fold PLP-dependent enzyme [Bacteroidales bacterium]|nr:aminotransferase class V-fold PLP-dependent enzyme [Bacteroidales bacterium]